jgi:hypothetical protein
MLRQAHARFPLQIWAVKLRASSVGRLRRALSFPRTFFAESPDCLRAANAQTARLLFHNTRSLRPGVLVWIGLMLLIPGCASPDAATRIQAFSNATTLTADNTAQAFKLVEDKYFETQVSREVSNYNTNSGFNPSLIKPFLDPQELQVRLDILQGLKLYAEKLSALMGIGQLNAFDDETKSLGQSLSAVDRELVQETFLQKAPLSDQDIDVFTTGINALGRWLTEYNRRAGAKESIDSMQKPVDEVCALLEKDFSFLKNQLMNGYNLELQERDSFILHNFNDLNPIQRRTEIQGLVDLTLEKQNADKTFASMEASLRQLSATHKRLKEAFSKNGTEIDALISQFGTEAKKIKTFYSSLQKAD